MESSVKGRVPIFRELKWFLVLERNLICSSRRRCRRFQRRSSFWKPPTEVSSRCSEIDTYAPFLGVHIVVPAANIVLSGPSGLVRTAKSGPDGAYIFSDVAPGEYTVQATVSQLSLKGALRVSLRSGSQTLNLVLHVVLEKQQVTVEENAKPTLSTEASANTSAVVLQGSDLESLSDNTDHLAADLQALAGPAADPTAARSMLTDLAAANFLRRPPSARSVSTRIRFPPSTTNWALAA